jgi:membrane associated rhomboid family serine protease
MNKFSLLPEVIKNLLIINGLFFMASLALGSTFGIPLIQILGLHLPSSELFLPFQMVTHMFMHADWGHLLFNMIALWMFGYALENVWGGKKFLIYYLLTGFGAALLHFGVQYLEYQSVIANLNAEQLLLIQTQGAEIISQGQNYENAVLGQANALLNAPMVGASGAVFGLLLAFGMLFPNQRIYLYFAIPVKAKYFVAGYGLLELINGLQMNSGSNVAHFAHLGGMLFGFLLLRYWKKNSGSYY